MLLCGVAGIAAAQRPMTDVPIRPDGPQVEGLQIHDIQIVGNRRVPVADIRGELSSRAGQEFRTSRIEQDVRRLLSMRKFLDVRVQKRPGPVPGTVIVIFSVVEHPRVEFIQFVGNEKIRTRALTTASGLSVGQSMDRATINSARKRLLEFYQERGYNKARIDVVRGLKTADRGIAYKISEGPQERIWSVSFEGNTIATDGRLKTQIKSKPGFLKYVFSGKVRSSTIDEDIDRLTSYYRSLGYFDAHVGRELEFSEDGSWLDLTYVIDEGPRYRVRDIIIRGNRVIRADQLSVLLEIQRGEFFDQVKFNKDHREVVDAYGSNGYIFADVKPSTRLLEEPGTLDLVFDIDEGDRYRVGRINVKIEGDHPHTRHTAVLNRFSLQPGDIVDTREVRATERRLRAAGIFLSDPATGARPRVVYTKPEKNTATARRSSPGSSVYRGQSPDLIEQELQGIEIEFERIPPLPSVYEQGRWSR